MKVSIADYTSGAARHILLNLSDRSKFELHRCGFSAADCLFFSQEDAKHSWRQVIVVDGEPAALFGATSDTVEPNTLRLWFMATDAYFKSGAAGIRLSRAVLREVAIGYEGRTLVSTTWVECTDKLIRWFKALGFGLVRRPGTCSVFQYGG